SCDPCPGPQLDYGDFATLGADVLAGGKGAPPTAYEGGFVLTRLHARYGKDAAPNDLVFKEAQPIIGGREVMGEGGKLEERATSPRTDDQAQRPSASSAARKKGCGCASSDGGATGGAVLLVAVAFARRRRRA